MEPSQQSEASLSIQAGSGSFLRSSSGPLEYKGVCSICSKVQSDDKLLIKFEQPVVMCDRCDFVNEIVKSCISAGILATSGTRHEIKWRTIDKPDEWAISYGVDEKHTDDEFILRETNFWDDFDWFVWSEGEYSSSGTSGCKFEAFVLPGLPKPFSDFPVKEINDTTASAHSLAMVQKWTRKCEMSHASCLPGNKLPALPKMILDVSLSRVRLHLTGNIPGRYVCLSHCWGTTIPACRTTVKTLEANLIDIPWNILPTTFQHTIDFTRRLGLQYIWIDSLCIIQDDARDWSEQSSLMADIYQNAYVTLCATASSSDDGGLYLSTPHYWTPRSIPVRKRDGVEYEIYIRHQMAERHFPPRLDPARRSKEFPLLTRAWTYQERLLSPRLVHFTAGEVMWECSEASACECYEPGTNARPDYLTPKGEKRKHQEAIEKSRSPPMGNHWHGIVHWFDIVHWHDIVSNYSALKLSFAKDKLTALSGVAKEISRLRPGDEYLAGLWRLSILSDLCWSMREKGSGVRPSVWRSPSWSWASTDGEIHYWQPADKYTTCVSACVIPNDSDPTGVISAAFLVLSGPTVSIRLREAQKGFYHHTKYVLESGGKEVQFEHDCDGDFGDGSLAVGDTLLGIRIGQLYCLVLKQVGSDSSDQGLRVYRRVGWCMGWHDYPGLGIRWFLPYGTENVLVKII